MAVGVENVISLVRRISSEDAVQREYGANTVSDWASLFDPEEADTVVRVLAAVASVEVGRELLEVQLHAIYEVSTHVEIRRASLYPLGPTELDAELADYLSDLGIPGRGD